MILVVDDDKNIRLSLKLILERNEYEVALAEGPKEAMQIVRNTLAVELVLMDLNYTRATDGEEGLTLLKQVKVFRPDLPVILMTAWGSIDLAVQGMRAGAFDFITKPWDNGVLLDRIETARSLTPNPSPRGEGSKYTQEQNQAVRVTTPLSPWRGVGGEALSGILATVARVAPTNAPVLITGESGTGKELIAEAIHRQSQRANGPFVKVNLGGISTSLFESEMFGHKKGSFTDAKADRIGRFELAKGGTIFLDEIGELSLASQVKLLRVLQDQTYEVLGDSRTHRTDVRVICATNADLRAMVEEKTFREDLYYRINIINLHLPPLRDRREDIPLLVDHFLRMTCEANNLPLITASTEAIGYLQTLPFPGNIRELKNLVERALLMKDPPPTTPCEGGEWLLTATDFQNSYTSVQRLSTPLSPWREAGGEASLSSMERNAIAACIAKHNGNLSLVAKELGISRGALYRKIEKHGL
ncbi:MAG: sigma-54-dependent Fis family transcriptional regulator [Prevotella sp.]|nr:sigma-54-dependent Fis family transcriptional regulator [Prevotella sp.]MBR3092848.1 sigma-54-dependent Fis family transcriptional regulator [Bacteroidaceae bacterium]MBR3093838.1 sigma-54-dependent Fis family transcriptional regulator [Bacteroidaceae bacterium]